MPIDSSATTTPLELIPLKITCTSSDCESDLHCFKATRKLVKENRAGVCRSCGLDLIDWHRIHQRDAGDVQFTFEQLRHELIRHHFWHLEFDERAIQHARRKGRIRLYADVRQRLRSSVGKAGSSFDGRQTPMSGNTLFYAQHATASCCRTCMGYWHGIPKDRDLTEAEIDYLEALTIRYLDERIPDLEDGPVRIPRARSR